MKLFRKFLFIFGLCASAITPADAKQATALTADQQKILSYVDPFIGTGGHGHTFPGAVVPFGMVQLSPDNVSKGWDWTSGYNYADDQLIGFSHTHLSGTGVGDLLDILVMPFHGDYLQIKKSPKGRPFATYSHAREQASPGYYRVHLDEFNIDAELTATERVGVHRYKFAKTDGAKLLFDLGYAQNFDKSVVTYLRVMDNQTLVGYRLSTGWAKYQPLYFVAHFDKPFSYQLYEDGVPLEGALAQTQKGEIVLDFGDLSNKSLTASVALSYVSIDGAQKNLEAEVPALDFDKVKARAQIAWHNQIGRFSVQDKNETAKTKFYTALYHSFLAPQLFSDVDGRYFGADGAVHQNTNTPRYTLFSLWDTFRALHPLLTITDPSRVNAIGESLLGFYDENGLLPTWDLMSNETDVMIGYHAVPVLVDAYKKGLLNTSAERVYVASLASATQKRFGIDLFQQYGYVPSDLNVEAVSKTLEYAFDDYAISLIAQAANRPEEAAAFSKRANAYKQLFDPQVGFMRGKTSKGEWVSPFNPTYVSHRKTDYTEANAWQYSFFVLHDIQGLLNLYGGQDGLEAKLDELFSMSSEMQGDVSPDISGLIGQYAHGNEPVHHVAYLYAYTKSPWKGEARVRQIRDTLYHAEPNGLAGNDDLGQMSAWYVFSALGFYPLNPVSGEFVLGSPAFDKLVINLENGRSLNITKRKPQAGKYVSAVYFNGEKISLTAFDYKTLMQGGDLVFDYSQH